MRRNLALPVTAILVFVLDQWSKWLVMRDLRHGNVVSLFSGLLRIDFTRNSGAAFGLFQSAGVVFVVVAALVAAAIVTNYRKIAAGSEEVRLALGLVLGGALGNLADRIRLGYVVDFIDLRWWYVFNLADSAIVIGVGLLLLRVRTPIREHDP